MDSRHSFKEESSRLVTDGIVIRAREKEEQKVTEISRWDFGRIFHYKR
jgi:hypothetical protein